MLLNTKTEMDWKLLLIIVEKLLHLIGIMQDFLLISNYTQHEPANLRSFNSDRKVA